MKKIIFTVFVNIITFFLFALVIGYQVQKSKIGEELVVIESQVKVSENIANPFYEEKQEPVVVAVPMSNIANKGIWTWPTEKPYVITSYYQYRGDGFHNAIDIYSYKGYGSNVYSANNGTVVAASMGCTAGYTSCNSGRGNFIVINHNYDNYYTIYMHLSNINVNVNDSVEAGQIIGKVGNTGNVWPVPNSYNPYGGTHLHFGVFKGNPLYGGSSINPLNLY